MTVYFSLFKEKASEPPPNARPLHSPRLDPNSPPRDKLKMALPFSVFHLSVLVGLGRTPLCSFLSLAYSGAQLLYDVFQVQDDFSAFLSGEEGGRPAGYGQSVGTTRTQEGQVPLSQ